MPIIPSGVLALALLLDRHRRGMDRQRVGVNRCVARTERRRLQALALAPLEVVGARGPLGGVDLDRAGLLGRGALVDAGLEPLLRRGDDVVAGELDGERAVLDVLLASGE